MAVFASEQQVLTAVSFIGGPLRLEKHSLLLMGCILAVFLGGYWEEGAIWLRMVPKIKAWPSRNGTCSSLATAILHAQVQSLVVEGLRNEVAALGCCFNFHSELCFISLHFGGTFIWVRGSRLLSLVRISKLRPPSPLARDPPVLGLLVVRDALSDVDHLVKAEHSS